MSKILIKTYGGVDELKVGKYFPYDCDTLFIVKEMEESLGLENKDIDKMDYTELIEYIDQLALGLLSEVSLV